MRQVLRFRLADSGEITEAATEVEEAETRAGEYLVCRSVKLDDGTVLRQHRVPEGDARRPGKGYVRLDSEIYVGRILHEVAPWGDYPAEVTCLYGDDADSTDPCALFERYRGEPLREAVQYIDHSDYDAFAESLLTALCWLAAAGVAHRSLNPDTVYWDGETGKVEVTDFSRAAVFGSQRSLVTGLPDWIAPESRRGRPYGHVGRRDDIWAAGRLIYFVQTFARNQGRPPKREDLAGTVFDVMLGPPEGRPLASDLLEERGRRDPSTGSGYGRAWLSEGRARFLEMRAAKHPNASRPPDFFADLGSTEALDGVPSAAPHSPGPWHSTAPQPGSQPPAPPHPAASPYSPVTHADLSGDHPNGPSLMSPGTPAGEEEDATSRQSAWDGSRRHERQPTRRGIPWRKRGDL